MKNIWRIFSRDVMGLVKNPLALVIALGLCALPSLYAWFNIYANWDPYANTSNIQIAVASTDKGFLMEDGTVANMGDQVLEELRSNEKIGWVFLDDSDAAVRGVREGAYYAAVVIGDEFTESMYNVFKDGFKGPSITYYENEKKNAVATKITDTAVSTLKQSINETFIEVVAQAVFAETNALSDEAGESEGIDRFLEKLSDLNDNLLSYSAMIDQFLDGNALLAEAVSDAKDEIPGLSEELSGGAKSFSDTRDGLSSTQATLEDFSASVEEALGSVKDSLDRVSSDIASTGLAGDVQNAAGCLNQTVTDTRELYGLLESLRDILRESLLGDGLTDEARQRIEGIIETIEALGGRAGDILRVIASMGQGADGVSQALSEIGQAHGMAQEEIGAAVAPITADAVSSALGSLSDVVAGCTSSVENMQDLYVNSLVPQLDGVIDGMGELLGNVSDILSRLDASIGSIGTVFDGIETTVDQASDSFGQIQTVIGDVTSRLGGLLEKMESVSGDDKVQSFLKFLDGDPERYGEFFAKPVTVRTEQIYPVPTYGMAMAPFYSVLAMWFGGTVLVSLVKVQAEPDGLEDVKPWQLYLGRYLLFFVLGQLQAVMIVWGDIYLLHCQVLYPGLFLLAACLSSMTFTLFIYTMALAFGDIGKAAAVVIMVIQIAGSSGTFPIELLPGIYQSIYIFFPFPYAINAMRETIGGMYGSVYMENLAKLMIFDVVALAIGLVIRLPFVRLIHFMEKRMEDTGMM